MNEVFDYRQLLREELNQRVSRNAFYSARALARDMGVSSGYLSQVMAAKQSLNEERAREIAERLRWSEEKVEHFVALVRSATTREFLPLHALSERLETSFLAE